MMSSQTSLISFDCTAPQISWHKKFGMAASTCKLAIPPTGPSHACGAIRIPAASASAATFHSAVMPPTCAISGWSTSTTPSSISSLNPYAANQPLPGSQRCCGAFRDTLHRPHIFRRTDFFCEQQMQRLNLPHNNGSHAGARLRMKIHSKIDIRS